MRLFVAINVPSDERERLWASAAPLRDHGFPVRWVGPEALHLTLKFLGEVRDERLDELRAGVDAAIDGVKPFEMPIGGFGAFPHGGNPRVVWVGCEAVPPLELLQHQVERTMAHHGFDVEGRPFRPHITLGRARRDARARDFAEFEAVVASLDYAGTVRVERLDLMESELTPHGARYSVRHAAILAD